MAEAPTVKRGLAWANSIEWQFSAISNADGDGKLDVLLASPALYPYALNGPDGSQLWAFQAISGFLTPPSVADLNGVPEVVVGSFDSLVYCLHGPSGSLRWKLNLATDPHSPFSGDVDGDGCSEVVMGTNGSDAAERFLFVLDDRGGATLCGTAVLFRGWLPTGEHRFSPRAEKRGLPGTGQDAGPS